LTLSNFLLPVHRAILKSFYLDNPSAIFLP
jgi:hypothetical protein